MINEALDLGLKAFMVTALGGSGMALTLFLMVGLAHIFSALDDLLEAVRRYAHRRCVILEYYDDEKMSYMRRLIDVQPWQVKLAKQGKRSSKPDDRFS